MNYVDILKTDIRLSREIFIYECGYEICSPTKPFEYIPIDYYLMHYIVKGEGIFIINGLKHHLKKGDIFFIPPNTSNKYYPIKENPWTYKWIGFNGSECMKYVKMCGFEDGNYIISNANENLSLLFSEVYKSFKDDDLVSSLGYLYQILGNLIKKYEFTSNIDTSINTLYINKAIKFIEDNYNKNITVSDIAQHIKINRSHLFKIFKATMNQSPQQYIINYKLNKACDLLRKSTYSINGISDLIGFSSAEYFSRLFKKYKSISPSQYRYKYIKN